MNRRNFWIGGAVAVAAGGAGVGSAIWRATRPASPTSHSLWDLSFDTPDGGRLLMASFRGKPLLVNFWASWCPPCVSELPLVDRFRREQNPRGWEVVGIAVDTLEPVRNFLGKSPVGFPIALAGMEGVGLSRSLGNDTGALPFTVVFDTAGEVARRQLGVLTEKGLAAWVSSVH